MINRFYTINDSQDHYSQLSEVYKVYKDGDVVTMHILYSGKEILKDFKRVYKQGETIYFET